MMQLWIPLEGIPPFLEVRIKLKDSSEMEVHSQLDGDFWSEQLRTFIDPSHVTHWIKSSVSTE
jgi:hypothetical protein